MSDTEPTKGKGKERESDSSPATPVLSNDITDRLANRARMLIPLRIRDQIQWGEIRRIISQLDETQQLQLYSTFGALNGHRLFQEFANEIGFAASLRIPPVPEGSPVRLLNMESFEDAPIEALFRTETTAAGASSEPGPSRPSRFIQAALDAIRPPRTVARAHEAVRNRRLRVGEWMDEFIPRYVLAQRMSEHAETEDPVEDILTDLTGELLAITTHTTRTNFNAALQRYLDEREARRLDLAQERLSLDDRWNGVVTGIGARIQETEERINSLEQQRTALNSELQVLGPPSPSEETYRYVNDDIIEQIDERIKELDDLLKLDLSAEAANELRREQQFQQRQLELYEQIVELEGPFIPLMRLPLNSPARAIPSIVQSWAEKQKEFEQACDSLISALADEVMRHRDQQTQLSRQSLPESARQLEPLTLQLDARYEQLRRRRQISGLPHYDFNNDQQQLYNQPNIAPQSQAASSSAPDLQRGIRTLDHGIASVETEIRRINAHRSLIESSAKDGPLPADQQEILEHLTTALRIKNLSLKMAKINRQIKTEGETGITKGEIEKELRGELNKQKKFRRQDILHRIGELERTESGYTVGALPNERDALGRLQESSQRIPAQDALRKEIVERRSTMEERLSDLRTLPEEMQPDNDATAAQINLNTEIVRCNSHLKQASEAVQRDEQLQAIREHLSGLIRVREGETLCNVEYRKMGNDGILIFDGNSNNIHFTYEVPAALQAQLRQQARRQLNRDGLNRGDRITFTAVREFPRANNDETEAQNVMEALQRGLVSRILIAPEQPANDVLFIGEESGSLLFTVREAFYPVVYELPANLQGQIRQEAQRLLGVPTLFPGDWFTFVALPPWDTQADDRAQAATIADLHNRRIMRTMRSSDEQQFRDALYIRQRSNRNLLFAEMVDGYPFVYELSSDQWGQIAQRVQQRYGLQRNIEPGDRLTFSAVPTWQTINDNTDAANIAHTMTQGHITPIALTAEQQMNDVLFIGIQPNGDLLFAQLENNYPVVYALPANLQGQIRQQARIQHGSPDLAVGTRLTFTALPHWNENANYVTEATAIESLLDRNVLNALPPANSQRFSDALFIRQQVNGNLLFAVMVDGHPLVYDLPANRQGQIAQRAQVRYGRANLEPGDRLNFIFTAAWNVDTNDTTEAANIAGAIRRGVIPLQEAVDGQQMENALFVRPGMRGQRIFANTAVNPPLAFTVPNRLQGHINHVTQQPQHATLQPGNRSSFTVMPPWIAHQDNATEAARVDQALQGGYITARHEVLAPGQGLQDALVVRVEPQPVLFTQRGEQALIVYELPNALRSTVDAQAEQQLGHALQPGDRLTINVTTPWNALNYNANLPNLLDGLLQNGQIRRVIVNNEQPIQNALFLDPQPGGALRFARLENGYPVVYVLNQEWQGQIQQDAQNHFQRNLQPGDSLTVTPERQWVRDQNPQTEANNIRGALAQIEAYRPRRTPNMGETINNAIFVGSGQANTLVFATYQQGVRFPQIIEIPRNQQGDIARQIEGRGANLQPGDELTFTTEIPRQARRPNPFKRLYNKLRNR